MEHQRRANLRAQMLRIGGDGTQGLGGNIEQQAVEYRLVVPGDRADRGGQREDHVILHRQQVGLTCLEPPVCGARLALRAMPITTRVIGDLQLCAAGTAQHMSTQRRGAALFDGRHDLQLSQAQLYSLSPRWPVDAEDVCDLQHGALRAVLAYSEGRRSSGLITLRSRSVATWV